MDTPATGSAAASRSSSTLTYAILLAVAAIGIVFAFSSSSAIPNNWYSAFKAVHVLLAGIAMMANTSWGWGHFWVIVGLVGYASTFIVGVGVLSPLAKKIAQSAETNGAEHPETLALVDRIMLIGRFDVAVLLLVVLDMVLKPFA